MNTTVSDAVLELRRHLAERIGGSRYQTWFEDATQIELESDLVRVVAANEFIATWIGSNYLADVAEAGRRAIGGDVRVVVELRRAAAAAAPANEPSSRAIVTGGRNGTHAAVSARPPAGRAPAGREPGAGAANRSDSPALHASTAPRASGAATPLALRGQMDSFVVGPSNQLAVAAARSLVAAPAGAVSVLFLHGGCGLGKTHLLQGICNSLSDAHPQIMWRYVSGEQFTNEYILAVRTNRHEQFRARFRAVDVLVIDDIHFLAGKKATQDEFLHTFDAIDSRGKAVVLSSDRHPRQFADWSAPLLSRLVAGIVVEIQAPDLATRREILLRRARSLNVTLPHDVAEMMAAHITRNVRELEGALYKLVAVAALMREPISLTLARTALAEQLSRTRAALGVEEIEALVCERFGVTRAQLHSRSRDHTISQARAITMLLVRKHTTLSFPEIARAMGHKNHTTVLMATKRVQGWLSADNPITWRTPQGTQSARLRELLGELEDALLRAR